MSRGSLRANFRRVAVAVLLFGLSRVADAVPIYLDFTGTVTATSINDAALQGTTISGGFTLETDNLFPLDSSGPVRDISYVQFFPGLTSDPLAYLNVGGEQLTWIASPYNGYAGVGFQDACTADGCVPGWSENLSWNANYNGLGSGADGTFSALSLALISSNAIRYPDYPFIEYFDYFDGDDVTALSAVTLPLYDMVGLFAEEQYVCVAGDCQFSGQRFFNFSIDSVVRGVGEREVSVPEPGPLGLFAAALLGMVLVRRRAAAKPA